MKYAIEADWHLLDTCNYRCAYCFFGPATLGTKLRTFCDPKGWSSAFEASGSIWLLHMTGGEPSIYPNFVELCEQLTVRQFISQFQSNARFARGFFEADRSVTRQLHQCGTSYRRARTAQRLHCVSEKR